MKIHMEQLQHGRVFIAIDQGSEDATRARAKEKKEHAEYIENKQLVWQGNFKFIPKSDPREEKKNERLFGVVSMSIL